jgi:hypothetical protein
LQNEWKTKPKSEESLGNESRSYASRFSRKKEAFLENEKSSWILKEILERRIFIHSTWMMWWCFGINKIKNIPMKGRETWCERNSSILTPFSRFSSDMITSLSYPRDYHLTFFSSFSITSRYRFDNECYSTGIYIRDTNNRKRSWFWHINLPSLPREVKRFADPNIVQRKSQ